MPRATQQEVLSREGRRRERRSGRERGRTISNMDLEFCFYWDPRWGAWGFMGSLFLGEFKT